MMHKWRDNISICFPVPEHSFHLSDLIDLNDEQFLFSSFWVFFSTSLRQSLSKACKAGST